MTLTFTNFRPLRNFATSGSSLATILRSQVNEGGGNVDFNKLAAALGGRKAAEIDLAGQKLISEGRKGCDGA